MMHVSSARSMSVSRSRPSCAFNAEASTPPSRAAFPAAAALCATALEGRDRADMMREGREGGGPASMSAGLTEVAAAPLPWTCAGRPVFDSRTGGTATSLLAFTCPGSSCRWSGRGRSCAVALSRGIAKGVAVAMPRPLRLGLGFRPAITGASDSTAPDEEVESGVGASGTLCRVCITAAGPAASCGVDAALLAACAALVPAPAACSPPCFPAAAAVSTLLVLKEVMRLYRVLPTRFRRPGLALPAIISSTRLTISSSVRLSTLR
mmetsp:Transcript_38855/g.86429  ORF Transcript_38855/g.86429 Transcript_38855/m.86429 type:complete len:265 (-) Transcript_38855:1027-1821(-)